MRATICSKLMSVGMCAAGVALPFSLPHSAAWVMPGTISRQVVGRITGCRIELSDSSVPWLVVGGVPKRWVGRCECCQELGKDGSFHRRGCTYHQHLGWRLTVNPPSSATGSTGEFSSHPVAFLVSGSCCNLA